MTLELGYIYYYFPDTPGTADTQEVYLSAAYTLPWEIVLSAAYYYDFDSNNGWYFQPELSYNAKNRVLTIHKQTGTPEVLTFDGCQPRLLELTRIIHETCSVVA